MHFRQHCLIPLLLGTAAMTAAAEPKLQGIYSNMEPSVEQGELIGTEVFILPYVDQDAVTYTALVQFADGLPTRPQLVEVQVENGILSFLSVHPEAGEVRFTGSVDSDGLTGQFEGLGEIRLPRGESIWQWGAAQR